MKKIRAISIRQPWVEQIFRGEKEYEYRNMRCKIIDEEVYIYSSPGIGKLELEEFEKMKIKPGDLPTGVLVGTIKFESCDEKSMFTDYRWKIKDIKQLKKHLNPIQKPQPVWFNPFGK